MPGRAEAERGDTAGVLLEGGPQPQGERERERSLAIHSNSPLLQDQLNELLSGANISREIDTVHKRKL